MRSLHAEIARTLLLPVFLIAFVAAGCGSGRGRAVTVTFWAMGNEGEHVQRLVPGFEGRHPGIKVKVQQIPWTAAHEKLLTAFAGNSLPDACQLGNTWVPEFTLLGALENVDQWTDQSEVIDPSDYFSGIWETNVIDRSVYGIPWYVDTRLLYYRTDLLAKAGYPRPPRTWEEWLDVSIRIREQSGGADRYAMFLPTNEWVPFVVAGLQGGSSLLRDGDRYGDFSGHEFSSSFKFLMSFYRQKLAPIGMTKVTNIYQSMAEGYFAMYITGPWNIGEFSRRFPKELQGSWMTAPLPGPDSTYPGISLAGGSSLVLFKHSKRKPETWKFIEYLSEPRQQLAFYSITGNLPARREAWRDTVLAGNRYVKAFYEQLDHVVATPKIPEWEQIAMKIQQYAEMASMQTVSVDDALAALDRDVNGILEKRRWIMERPERD